MAEFVAKAKANPGKLTIGSAGLGTVTHLANELFRREAKVDFTHVPYKSTANSLNDLLGGHIDAIFGDVALVKPQAEAGKLIALAVTGANRSPLMPDLATTAEVGFPAVQTEVWYGALISVKGAGAGHRAAQGRDAGGAERSGDAEGAGSAWRRAGRARRRSVCDIHPSGDRALDADRHHHQDAVTTR